MEVHAEPPDAASSCTPLTLNLCNNKKMEFVISLQKKDSNLIPNM